jgi:hypothetical protein
MANGLRHSLGFVKRLVRKGKLTIRDNAFFGASDDFGWSDADIVDALLKLRGCDYYKSDASEHVEGAVVHYYKARGLKGQDVYMHLYIDARGRVVLNSCKRLDGSE